MLLRRTWRSSHPHSRSCYPGGHGVVLLTRGCTPRRAWGPPSIQQGYHGAASLLLGQWTRLVSWPQDHTKDSSVLGLYGATAITGHCDLDHQPEITKTILRVEPGFPEKNTPLGPGVFTFPLQSIYTMYKETFLNTTHSEYK